ncbi:MAG: hypothetical protein U0W24_02680 [Bacteroidales bacterium]
MQNRKVNKAILRVIQKKIEYLKKIEADYWKLVEEQRQKLFIIDPKFKKEFDEVFPENQSSLIYGCIDGAVLLRYRNFNNQRKIDVQIFDNRLEKFLKELPVPNEKGGFFNFSSLIPFSVNSVLKNVNVNINDNSIVINNLDITAFHYSDDKTVSSFEDVLTDVQLAILGINSNQEIRVNVTPEQQKDNLLNKLVELKNKYDNLLQNANREEEIQVFLKEHPILIQPYSKVIPKQKLADDFITDFVFASTLDQGIKYTFVELERISIPIFTEKGEFTADFKHAENQTLDWDIWLEKNIDFLRREKLHGLESPTFLIIAGRSTKFSDKNKEKIRAWNRRQKNTEFLTYDDISVKIGELIDNLKNE